MPYYYSPFRKEYRKSSVTPNTPQTCPLCDASHIETQTFRDGEGTLVENDHYRWFVNWYPRAEAHTMIVPKRHITALTDETPEETLSRHALTLRCIKILSAAFNGSGYEYFLQTGAGSLGTLPHLHWHLIPTLPQHSLKGFEKIGFFDTDKPTEEKVVLTPIEITIAREKLIELIATAAKGM